MDLLRELDHAGGEYGVEYITAYGGFFGWSVFYENGFSTLVIGFTDVNNLDAYGAPEAHTKKYRLIPVEGSDD